MKPALSDVSVTEFLVLARTGFVPRGLVAGSCLFNAGTQYDWDVRTGEITRLSDAIREAQRLAVERMRQQAAELRADGVVSVRISVEHHIWRGGRQVAQCLAMGTAVAFDRKHAPAELGNAPQLHLANGQPFGSDLKGRDFVALLGAGYRPLAVAMGTCVYGLDPRTLRQYRGRDTEITEFTQAFFDARESAMNRLQQDLFSHGSRPGAPRLAGRDRRDDRQREDVRRAGRLQVRRSSSSPPSGRRSLRWQPTIRGAPSRGPRQASSCRSTGRTHPRNSRDRASPLAGRGAVPLGLQEREERSSDPCDAAVLRGGRPASSGHLSVGWVPPELAPQERGSDTGPPHPTER